jgi:hypothetical protein
MSMQVNPLRQLCETLRDLRIRYAVVGSLASSARGIPRSTIDGDVVAAISVRDVGRLVAALGGDWYADAEQMKAMVAAGRSFNIIYQPLFFKFDVFPAVDEFQQRELERAQEVALLFLNESVTCSVVSPEDILLSKLRWYRDGGEVSERQWSDIHGILAITKNLDFEYVNRWAASLGVSDLLARALSERS